MIPTLLKAQERWLLWRYETLDGGRATKVPIRVDGQRASSTNPEHWVSFADAIHAAGRRRVDGLGFVVAPGIPAVDLDHVRNPHTGDVVPWARRVIETLDSYTEFSPSGSGFHVFFCGSKPEGRSNMRFPDGTAFEVYDRARFLTVTGAHVAGTPFDLRAVPDATVARVYDEMLARLPEAQRRPPSPIVCRSSSGSTGLEDAEVLSRMFASRRGAELTRLYHGDHSYPSQSDADLRLCGALAFWTGRDPAQIDRLFRCSALHRPKWDERHGADTYGARTIERAIGGCTVTLSLR